ncbi:MAG TPA: DUF4157 domain-containing protein [Longimicrobium sp.]|nr:DUF4157 domain-containing protein [Longimicrobium sp.]
MRKSFEERAAPAPHPAPDPHAQGAPAHAGSPAGLPRYLGLGDRSGPAEHQARDFAGEGARPLGAPVPPPASPPGRGPALPLGPGEPLPEPVRDELGPRVGVDLAAVRVHADPAAGRVARGLGARAFTAGRDIVFGPGRYSPGTAAGDRLLAHEVAHVAQQGAAGRAGLQFDLEDQLTTTTWTPGMADEYSPEELEAMIGMLEDRVEADPFLAPGGELENLSTLREAYWRQASEHPELLTSSADEAEASVSLLDDADLMIGECLDPSALEPEDAPIAGLDMTREAVRADYTANARQLLLFRMETMYAWVDTVVRAQVTGPDGEGSEEAAEALRAGVPRANELGREVWNAKALVHAYDDLISVHLPPEGVMGGAPVATIGIGNYIRNTFSRDALRRMGYPADEFPDFLAALAVLGARRSPTDAQIAEAAQRLGFTDPSDPDARAIATSMLGSGEEYDPDPAELAVIDREAVDPGYTVPAIRLVVTRARVPAQEALRRKERELAAYLDGQPLLRMFISDTSVLSNEFLPGRGYQPLIDEGDIEASGLIGKLEELLDDIDRIKGEVASDDDFLFDSAIRGSVEDLISMYAAVDPRYAEWIGEEFSSNDRWRELWTTLLIVTALMGALAAGLGGGLATAGAVTSLAATTAAAVRSSARADLLSAASHAGVAGYDDAAIARFQAAVDAASLGLTIAPALTRGTRMLVGRVSYNARMARAARAAPPPGPAPPALTGGPGARPALPPGPTAGGALPPGPTPGAVWQPSPRVVDPGTGDLVVLTRHVPSDTLFEMRINPATGNGRITHLDTGRVWHVHAGRPVGAAPGALPEPAPVTPAPSASPLPPHLAGRLGEVTRFEEVGLYPARFTRLFTPVQRARLYGMLQRGEITLTEFSEMLGPAGAEQVYIRTPWGGRYVDHMFSEGQAVVLRESKNVANFAVGADVNAQLQKDLWILQNHPEARVHWRISGNGHINPEAYDILEATRELYGGRFQFQLQDSVIPPSHVVTPPPTVH